MSNQSHWTEQKEVIKTNKPLKLLLLLLKHIPGVFVRALIYPVSFFYYVFVKEARKSAEEYQKQLRDFTGRNIPPRISPYKQILSFALCVLEKMEGWLGKIKFSKIQYHNDDISSILELLKQGKGAMLITSHLGNMELMRSLSDYNVQLVGREVPVYVIMDMDVNSNFSQTLKSVNPKVSFNVINSNQIGPDSMVTLMEAVEQGALVVVAGDRTSPKSKEKVLRINFLGKEASFPYGVFLIPALMKVPVYFMFGLRSKLSIFNPKQNVYIEKCHTDFNCSRTEREERIIQCCGEFVARLEKYCILYPYQWYNFFDFWQEPDKD